MRGPDRRCQMCGFRLDEYEPREYLCGACVDEQYENAKKGAMKGEDIDLLKNIEVMSKGREWEEDFKDIRRCLKENEFQAKKYEWKNEYRLDIEAKAKDEEAKRIAAEHAFRTPLRIKRMPLTIHHHGGKKR